MRGKTEPEVEQLCQQLMRYRAGINPFNQARGGAAFNVRDWWLAVGASRACNELVHLALVLHDIVPHAAAPERTFSLMGWYESGNRHGLGIQTNAMMAAIKQHYQQQQVKSQLRKVPADAHTAAHADDRPHKVARQDGMVLIDVAEGEQEGTAGPGPLQWAQQQVEQELAASSMHEPGAEEGVWAVDELDAILQQRAREDEAFDMQAEIARQVHATHPDVPAEWQYLSFTELLMGDWGGFDLHSPELFEPGNEAPEVKPPSRQDGLGSYENTSYDYRNVVARMLHNGS